VGGGGVGGGGVGGGVRGGGGDGQWAAARAAWAGTVAAA